jgi:hypothetical protein
MEKLVKAIKKIFKKIINLKARGLVLIFGVWVSHILQAQELIPSQLQNLADQISAVFTGPFVRTIIVIMLAGSAVGFAVNKDNEKMKKHFGAIVIAIAIIAVAQFIVSKIYQSAS